VNPEFRRNLWLEMTPRRTALMTGALALAFFAAALSGGDDYRPVAAAQTLYYFIVVFWGSRNAALSVVGEIRDRTWDSQRLSSLGAGQMSWGKLFGSTIYNWYGGAICLALILASRLAYQGPVAALIDLVYFVSVGVIAQSVALLASLVAIRRRQSHTRFEIFLYQIAGILAAIAVFYVWSAADPAGSFVTLGRPTDLIAWWGGKFDARPFLLVSLALFAGWTLVACYREMRLELKMRNGPAVWFAFLLFIGIYVAGFDAWLSSDQTVAQWDIAALRLALAATAYGVLTYAMVLLEPKDRVLYRWLGGQLLMGRLDRVLRNLQGWMMSYFAAALTAVALAWWLGQHAPVDVGAQALIVAGLGFLTRDCAIFVLFHTLPGRRRSDFGAIVVLVALYALVPAILDGLGFKSALGFFYPEPTDPVWLGAAVAWAQGLLVAVIALGRLAISEGPQAEEPIRA
jgi:hypothetical protein